MKKNKKFQEQDQILIPFLQNTQLLDIHQKNARVYLGIYLITQLSILTSIINGIFVSMKITTIFGQIQSKMFAVLTLYSNTQLDNKNNASIIRFIILFLNVASIIIIAITVKNQGVTFTCIRTLQKTLHLLFSVQLVFAGPVIFFSACQIMYSSVFDAISTFIDILNIGYSLTLIYNYEKFAIETQYGKGETTKSTYNQNKPVLKCCRAILACTFITTSQQSNNQFAFLSVILLALTLVDQNSFFAYRKHTSPIIQTLSELRVSSSLALSVLAILLVIFPGYLIRKNFDILLIMLTFFFYQLHSKYYTHKQTKMLIQGIEAIKDDKTAISYALELIFMQQHKGRRSNLRELIISLILQEHPAKCMDETCLCRQKSNTEDRNKLFEWVVIHHLQVLSQQFPFSFGLKFINLGYKLSHCPKLINSNLEVSKLLRQSESKDLSLQDRFILQELAYKIHRKFDKQTQLYNEISCQNVFIENDIKVEVGKHLTQLIELIIRKYKLISMDYYTFTAVEEFSQKINNLIAKIEENWRQIKKINSFSLQMYQIFIFYFQGVIPSQIEAKHIIQDISEKLGKLRVLKGVSSESINKYFYSKKTCVLQSDISQSFGKITNASENCKEVLGIVKDRLLDIKIHSIMPEFFAKDHEFAVQNWIKTGTAQSKTSMVEFGYVDAKLTCFQGFLFLKLLSDGEKLLFYSTVIRENDSDYILLNSKLEIEGIGKRLIKEEILVKEHIRHSITEYPEVNMEKAKIGAVYRTCIQLQNLYKAEKLQEIAVQLSRNQNYQRSKLRFQCDVAITKYNIGQTQYYLIKFQSIKKNLATTQQYVQLRQNICKNPMGSTGNMEDGQFLQDQYESVDPDTNALNYTHAIAASTKHSQASTVSTSQVSVYNNFILEVKRLFINPNKIPMGFFKKMSLFLIVICSIVVTLFFSFRSVFMAGFDSFNDVMYGDGAVSDNNMLLQILYHNIIMAKVHCSDTKNKIRCQYLLNNIVKTSNIYYGLYESDIEVYLKNITSLSSLKFYASYDIKVSFKVGNSSQQVTTLQFMEYYYFAIKNQGNLIAQGKFETTEVKQAMSILIDNWQTMKFINHNAFDFYIAAGQKELKLLMTYLSLLVGGIFTFLIVLAIGMERYDAASFSKSYDILSIYDYRSNQFTRDMLDYYANLKENIATLRFRSCKIKQEGTELRRKEMKYERKKWKIIQIGVLLSILLIFGGIQIMQISIILPPCKNMVIAMNNLMNSESYLLEPYFDMKTYYLQSNVNKSVNQITKDIAFYLNQTEPDFTKMATKSIGLFSSDKSYAKDLNALLVTNVCTLAKQFFSPQQVKYCNTNFTFNALSKGLVDGTTFLQRRAYSALLELKRRQQQNISKTKYFRQAVFRDIDDSIFYMFRLFQAIQVRMYQGLNNSVSNSLLLLDFINSFTVAVILFILARWFLGYRGQRRKLSQLYGALLQLPEAVIKKTVLSKVISHLEMQI